MNETYAQVKLGMISRKTAQSFFTKKIGVSFSAPSSKSGQITIIPKATLRKMCRDSRVKPPPFGVELPNRRELVAIVMLQFAHLIDFQWFLSRGTKFSSRARWGVCLSFEMVPEMPGDCEENGGRFFFLRLDLLNFFVRKTQLKIKKKRDPYQYLLLSKTDFDSYFTKFRQIHSPIPVKRYKVGPYQFL